jgi:hypothetical protein
MFEGEWTQYIFIVLIVLFLIWNIVRRRKVGNTNLDAAAGVLSEVNDNLRIMEERMANWQSKKKFKTSFWKNYSSRLDFLDQELKSKLNEAYAMADDFNARIDSARKNNSMPLLQDMQVSRLRDPLMKSKEGLVTWLRTNYQAEAQNNPRRGGCMGM